MPLVFIILLLAVIGVVAALLSGRMTASMAPPAASRPIQGLPAGPLEASDVESVRFSVGLRGYRMDEVDEALDRLRDQVGLLREEVNVRDAEISRLRAGNPAPRSSATGASTPGTSAAGPSATGTSATGAS